MKNTTLAGAALGGMLLLLVMTKKTPPAPVLVPRTTQLGKRGEIVRLAQAAVSNPPTPDDVWYDVAPSLVGTRAAWCGGFALWILHSAGVALDVDWTVGKGFAYQLPITQDPEPGDIAYFDKPYQHHAIVIDNSANDTITTVDGNQPGVARRVRDRDEATAYFSIRPLLPTENV